MGSLYGKFLAPLCQETTGDATVPSHLGLQRGISPLLLCCLSHFDNLLICCKHLPEFAKNSYFLLSFDLSKPLIWCPNFEYSNGSRIVLDDNVSNLRTAEKYQFIRVPGDRQ